MTTYMFVGAHPDDADIQFGGTAILLRGIGHDVVFVSMTDGSAGHQTMQREELAQRRLRETQNVARALGITYEVLNEQDGALTASLEARTKLIACIRTHKPDVIISPRPNDYHADHRATALLVQDASFLLTVPLVNPDISALDDVPHILFHQDSFKKPSPFTPEITIDITSVLDRKMRNLALHESQMFEWLPFVQKFDKPVPDSSDDRILWLKHYWGNPIEAFERCEYGRSLDLKATSALFPFATVNF